MSPKTSTTTADRIAAFATRGFLILVLVAGVAGFALPDLFTGLRPSITWLLGIVMLGMGMTLTPADFRRIAKRPWIVGLGALVQFGVMSLAAWVLVKVLRLDPILAVGVILVGTCPGGTASNVIAYLARGDVALSVSMTTVSTLLAPVLTPLLTLWLAGAEVPVDAGALFRSIALIVLVPVIAGLLLRVFLARIVERVLPVLPVVSVLAIVIIVAIVAALNAGRLGDLLGIALVAVILHNAIGLAAGLGTGKLARLTPAEARTLAVETGMQNSGLAAALAVAHFEPRAALPAALFSIWHNVTGPALAAWWTRKGAEPDSSSQSEDAV